MHSERAIATRCCWPPTAAADTCGLLGDTHALQLRHRAFLGLLLGIAATHIGASVRFSSTVKWGNS
jgi:hypothetical protein